MALPLLSPAQVWQAMQSGEAVWVDIRTDEEFALGHPPGAYHLPFMHADEVGGRLYNDDFVAEFEALQRSLSGAGGGAPLMVLGCRRGHRTRQAVELLGLMGLVGLADCPAGWSGTEDEYGRVVEPGWSRVGLPGTQEVAPGCSHAEIRALRSGSNPGR